tara:strand:+ start:9364 stop:9582 length:219 start_codon:yes stop_codon:yes gene_type:complete
MKYVIYNTSELNQVNFNEVIETSLDTLRVSNDGTKCVLKFIGETPSFLINYEEYNRQQMIELLTPDNGWGTN